MLGFAFCSRGVDASPKRDRVKRSRLERFSDLAFELGYALAANERPEVWGTSERTKPLCQAVAFRTCAMGEPLVGPRRCLVQFG